MDLKDFLPLASSFAGALAAVALGWWLNQRSSREQHERERRQRSDEHPVRRR